MRFDFSRFLGEVEYRFRRMRGLSLAFQLLFLGSLAGLIVSVGIRWLYPVLPLTISLFALALPLIAAGAAYVAGWMKRPVMPRLLLQLDDALETNARMSSLYEIRRRGTASVFREQLEAKVEGIARSSTWKEGLRLPRRAIGFLAAGIAGMLVASAILLVPVAAPLVTPDGLPAGSEGSATTIDPATLLEAAQPVQSPETSDGTAAPLSLPEDFDISDETPTIETTEMRSNDELLLDSILDDLSDLDRTRTQVDAPPTSDELADLAEAQEQARQALQEMLEDLQAQMQNNPRPLTQQESRQMQDLASQTGNPELEEKTDELIDEPNPEGVGEKLQDLMEELDPNEAQPEASPDANEEEGGSQGGNNSPQSTEISGDEEAGQRFLEETAEQLEEQANEEVESDDEGTPQQPSSQDDNTQQSDQGQSQDIRMDGDPDDLAQTGGDDGVAGEPGDNPLAGEIGFIREEAPSTIGSEGEFIQELVTRGVPVEIGESDSGSPIHIVDFERMESILDERALPDEAINSVRRYFELITQPEGGS